MNDSIFVITKKAAAFFESRDLIKFRLMLVLFILLALSELVGVGAIVPFLAVALDADNPPDNLFFSLIYKFYGPLDSNDLIKITGIISISAIVLANVMKVFCIYVTTTFEWDVQKKLSRKILNDSVLMEYRKIIKDNTAKYSRDTIVESVNFTQGLINPILRFYSSAFICIFLLGFLFFYNFVVASVAFLSLGILYGALTYAVQSYLIGQGEVRLEADKQRFRVVEEIFSAIKVIKSFKIEQRFLKNFIKPSQEFSSAQRINIIIRTIPKNILEVVVFAGLILIVMFSLSIGYKSSQIVPLAGLFAFTAMRMLPAATNLYQCFTLINYNKKILDKLSEYFKISSSDKELTQYKTSSHDASLQTSKKELSITFDEINFRYDESDKLILSKFKLNIPKGSIYALIGDTGSGKTTVIDLLMGLIHPEKGEIKVDGMMLEQYAGQKNSLFGYVPQDTILFDDTIAINISLEIEKSSIDMSKLNKAIKMAELDEFINKSSKGLDTMVGQRGVKLSGGQIQRIGIARAIYRDPKILILDESTSNLDQTTEHKIIENILSSASMEYVIMVAHRLSSLKNVDKIVMLSNGSVQDEGTYEELIENNIKFKALIDPSSQY
jgi:ATP-binding cassette, subfamily B, bacterial PglK